MAITDLTGYTWVGNDTLDQSTVNGSLNFNCDDVQYTFFDRIYVPFGKEPVDTLNYEPGLNAYASGSWKAEAYKTISITGGTDATNPDLIAWLEANGTLTKGGGGGTMLDVTYNSTKIIDSLEVTPPVSVTYNGSTIATLNEGDTKTLDILGSDNKSKILATPIVIGGKTIPDVDALGRKWVLEHNLEVEVGGVTPTGETWVINSRIYTATALLDIEIPFTSNAEIFTSIHVPNEGGDYLRYNNTYASNVFSGRRPVTTSMIEEYRTVTFETPPTGDLLTWLEANAVKQ